MIVGPTIPGGLRQYLKSSKVKAIFSTTLWHLTDSWSIYPHKASLLPKTRARSSFQIRQCHQLTKKKKSQNLNKMPSITNSSLTCLNNELYKKRKLESIFFTSSNFQWKAIRTAKRHRSFSSFECKQPQAMHLVSFSISRTILGGSWLPLPRKKRLDFLLFWFSGVFAEQAFVS